MPRVSRFASEAIVLLVRAYQVVLSPIMGGACRFEPSCSNYMIEALRDARERGIKRYNFWGITAEDDTKHRFYGVSQFKRSFGVDELIYLHAHDLIINPGKYKINYLIEKIRAKVRHV